MPGAVERPIARGWSANPRKTPALRNSGYRSSAGERVVALSNALSTKALYRKFRNFWRNRPETINQNHQYAIRRMFICPLLDAGVAPTGIMDSAKISQPM